MAERYAHPSWIEIDLGQFKKNIQIVKHHVGASRFCLPVKANAYGHGLCPIAHAAVEAGVDCLAVSCLQEGIRLRQAGIQIPILVLGAIHEDQVDDLIHFDLEFSISSKTKADWVAKKWERLSLNSASATKNQKCRIHLEVDTGMQRTGVRCDTAPSLFEYLLRLPCFEVVGVYSHLASAESPSDPIAQSQIRRFEELFKHPVFQGHRILRHIANSGGTLHFPESHLDLVRPGLVCYGYLPPNAPASLNGVAPCFSLKAKVSYFKVVAQGEGIGYGHTYKTQRQTRIATLPIGYGDGYRRSLSNCGSVLIRGEKFPIAGMICMDQLMVDLGEGQAYVGDEVVLIGKQGSQEISLEEVAALSNTIPYEILCLLNDRIPRIFL